MQVSQPKEKLIELKVSEANCLPHRTFATKMQTQSSGGIRYVFIRPYYDGKEFYYYIRPAEEEGKVYIGGSRVEFKKMSERDKARMNYETALDNAKSVIIYKYKGLDYDENRPKQHYTRNRGINSVQPRPNYSGNKW